jgi:hypothetical protein
VVVISLGYKINRDLFHPLISRLTLEGDQYCMDLINNAVASSNITNTPTCQQLQQIGSLLGCCAGTAYFTSVDFQDMFANCTLTLPDTICPTASPTFQLEVSLTFSLAYNNWTEAHLDNITNSVQNDTSTLLGTLPTDIIVTSITPDASGNTVVTFTLQGLNDAQTEGFQSGLENAFSNQTFTIEWTQRFYSDNFYHNQISLINLAVQRQNLASTTGTTGDVSSAVSMAMSFFGTVAVLLLVVL